jgi:hypothetical protein
MAQLLIYQRLLIAVIPFSLENDTQKTKQFPRVAGVVEKEEGAG